MSSKSRKRTPSPSSGGHEASARTEAASAVGHGHEDEHGLLGEEVIHVPKGKNRLRYAFMVGLMVFLTIIFLVPGAILNTFLHGRGDKPYLAFIDPSGRPVEMRQADFYEEVRSFSRPLDLSSVIQEFLYLRLFLGLPPRSIEHEQFARLVVLDRLAKDAGIVITDQDVADFLGSINGLSSDVWRQLTQRDEGPAKVEAGLKRLLGIRRYLDLVTQIARVPDIDRVEELWADEHVEIAYDYVALPTDGFLDAAKAEAPDDATLQTWLDGRSDFEKKKFFTPVRYRAMVAAVDDLAEVSRLVERYPDTSGDTPEAIAERYYNDVFFKRFKRPDPAEGESDFLSPEETHDVCMAEAPGYYATIAWINDMRSRVDSGEEVDFSAEAAEFGFNVISVDQPATTDQIREHEGLGAFVVGPITTTPPKQVAPQPVFEGSSLFVVQTVEKVDPEMPPFADVRDAVFESWAGERAKELALERLGEIRDGFESFEPEKKDEPDPAAPEAETDGEIVHRRTDEDAFRAAAEADGYDVGRRDWLDKSAPPTEDPDSAEPAHQFFARHRDVADLADGEVAEPTLDSTRETAYLALKVGQRPIDISKMTPAVYNNYKMRSAGETSNTVREYLTGEGLDQQYSIELVGKAKEPGTDDSGDQAPEKPKE